VKLTARHHEKFRKTTHHYQGKAVGFRVDQIRLPDGRSRGREYLTHPGAVGALAFTNQGKILLVKQFRYPVGQFTYEIPAGKLAKGEDPLDCVRRELEEETGFVAGSMKKLLSFWPTAAFSDEVIHLYIAEKLRPTRMNPPDGHPSTAGKDVQEGSCAGFQNAHCLSRLEKSRQFLHQALTRHGTLRPQLAGQWPYFRTQQPPSDSPGRKRSTLTE